MFKRHLSFLRKKGNLGKERAKEERTSRERKDFKK